MKTTSSWHLKNLIPKNADELTFKAANLLHSIKNIDQQTSIPEIQEISDLDLENVLNEIIKIKSIEAKMRMTDEIWNKIIAFELSLYLEKKEKDYEDYLKEQEETLIKTKQKIYKEVQEFRKSLEIALQEIDKLYENRISEDLERVRKELFDILNMIKAIEEEIKKIDQIIEQHKTLILEEVAQMLNADNKELNIPVDVDLLLNTITDCYEKQSHDIKKGSKKTPKQHVEEFEVRTTSIMEALENQEEEKKLEKTTTKSGKKKIINDMNMKRRSRSNSIRYSAQELTKSFWYMQKKNDIGSKKNRLIKKADGVSNKIKKLEEKQIDHSKNKKNRKRKSSSGSEMSLKERMENFQQKIKQKKRRTKSRKRKKWTKTPSTKPRSGDFGATK